jgi:hypothetical protein
MKRARFTEVQIIGVLREMIPCEPLPGEERFAAWRRHISEHFTDTPE